MPASSVSCLQLVKVVAQCRQLNLDVFALADSQGELVHLASSLHAVSWHGIPVVKHALRECLATRLLAQRRDEAEGLCDGQVRLHLDQGSSLARVLLKDASSPQVHAAVDAAHGLLRASDLHQEDWFLQRWLPLHLCCEAGTASWGHDLPCTSVDRIGVQRDICQVEADATHVLL